mmetsp:Transcript_123119/g.347933  ORF Transcript_123119/g.347933 Transcript_123119/m.347933 type:complete len:222 (-) Transcript_123119:402-1067(-)
MRCVRDMGFGVDTAGPRHYRLLGVAGMELHLGVHHISTRGVLAVVPLLHTLLSGDHGQACYPEEHREVGQGPPGVGEGAHLGRVLGGDAAAGRRVEAAAGRAGVARAGLARRLAVGRRALSQIPEESGTAARQHPDAGPRPGLDAASRRHALRLAARGPDTHFLRAKLLAALASLLRLRPALEAILHRARNLVVALSGRLRQCRLRRVRGLDQFCLFHRLH